MHKKQHMYIKCASFTYKTLCGRPTDIETVVAHALPQTATSRTPCKQCTKIYASNEEHFGFGGLWLYYYDMLHRTI